jgi:DNA-binding PadR family transcriptional regulator
MVYRKQYTMAYMTFPTTLVLQAIADGVRYGFDIADRTGLRTGTVYPALRRLEMLGCVRSSWESEKVARRDQRPARRYYELTRAGTDALAAARKRFEHLGRLNPGSRHA